MAVGKKIITMLLSHSVNETQAKTKTDIEFI